MVVNPFKCFYGKIHEYPYSLARKQPPSRFRCDACGRLLISAAQVHENQVASVEKIRYKMASGMASLNLDN